MNKLLRNSLLILFFTSSFSGSVSAETYYIDADIGNDNNSGTHDATTNSIQPWQSLVKAFSYSSTPGFNPGDSILLRRGQEHYAGNAEGGGATSYLSIFSSSGAPDQPIVFDAYGDAIYDSEGNDTNKPVVRMRVSRALDEEWVPSGTPGVWMLSRLTYNTALVFEDDLPLEKCADETCADGGNWYHYSENCSGCIHYNTLYYRPSSGTPQDHVAHFSRWGASAFDDQSYIPVRNLEFRTTHRPLRFRSINQSISNITVENCVFFATEFGPEFELRTSSPGTASNIKVLNNYSRYVMRAMSFISQSSPHGFDNAEIAYNYSEDANSHGVWTGDPELFYFQRVRNTHIHHNHIKGGQNTGIAMWNGNDGISSGNLIEKNFVQDLHGTPPFEARGWYLGSGGILDTCFNNTVRYNVVINSDVGLVPINCNVSTQAPNHIYNNTLVGNGTNLLYRLGTRSWEVKNNILAYPQATASSPVPVQVDHQSADNKFISQSNIYYPGHGLLFRYSGIEHSYQNWLSISQQDATSITENPLFVNATTADYRLLKQSPAVNTGEPLGQISDFDGNLIVDAPDIGAYEVVDADNDGYSDAVDCNDTDASIHPDAIEIPFDGIDQDCQSGDSTIIVLKATYGSKSGGKLDIRAVSSGEQSDTLSVEGYSAMTWTDKRGAWQLRQDNIGTDPGAVRITGLEGTIEVALD